MYRYNEENIGEFTEVDYGKNFTYRQTKNEWALKNGLQHEVDVGDSIRYATVMKTVVYMCIDEEAGGYPILERWKIKKHIIFVK